MDTDNRLINAVRTLPDDGDLRSWVLDWLECLGSEADASYIGDGIVRILETRRVVVDVDQEVYDYVDENGEDHERVRNVPIYGWDNVPVKRQVIPSSEKALIERLDRVMGCLLVEEQCQEDEDEEESYW